jgi:tRNA 2-thiouridine synthesizing protein A
MIKKVDTRNLPCPQPVIKTKQALEEGDFTELIVIVDNDVARQNVTRFVTNCGFKVTSVNQKGADFHITIVEDLEETAEDDHEDIENIKVSNDKLLLITSDILGVGDPELGKKLMGSFLFSLTQIGNKPRMIILMNSGVRLAIHGAEGISSLQALGKEGVDIIACGTCLDFYKLKRELAVGTISNMYDIAEKLMGKYSVIKI